MCVNLRNLRILLNLAAIRVAIPSADGVTGRRWVSPGSESVGRSVSQRFGGSLRRRDLFERFRRRKHGSDLQRTVVHRRRRSAVVLFDNIRQVLVGSDRNQGFQISGRQLTPEIHRWATELSELHHQLCNNNKKQKKLINYSQKTKRIHKKIESENGRAHKPVKEIERSTARTRVRPPA